MEHGCFQGKHKFHNFDKLIYMCYNCYNYHNLLITSASTNAQYSRTFLTEGIKFGGYDWLRLVTSVLDYTGAVMYGWGRVITELSLGNNSQRSYRQGRSNHNDDGGPWRAVPAVEFFLHGLSPL